MTVFPLKHAQVVATGLGENDRARVRCWAPVTPVGYLTKWKSVDIVAVIAWVVGVPGGKVE